MRTSQLVDFSASDQQNQTISTKSSSPTLPPDNNLPSSSPQQAPSFSDQPFLGHDPPLFADDTSRLDAASSLLAELENSLDQYGPLLGSYGDGPWAANLALECAKAVSRKEVPRVQHLLWILNELASPYGDCEQRLASCFLQALFCKISGTGARCYDTLCAAVERNCSFDSLRKTILKFQEASPWTTFGHVAANGAILEAVDGELRVHILDLSNTFCTQWPTLLEALATRPDGAPHLRLTTVIVSKEKSAMKAMKEVGCASDGRAIRVQRAPGTGAG